MLRSIAAYLFAATLLLLSTSAFRQALSEFRDTEPGSWLFGVLQLVIGVSAVVAAIGLVKRARWTAGFVAIWGVATVSLLAVQPLFATMDADAQRAIWLGAAAIGIVAAGVTWFAYRLNWSDAVSRTSAARASDLPLAPVSLAEARQPAEPIDARAPDAHESRSTQLANERSAER